jgi:hypothetical protein
MLKILYLERLKLISLMQNNYTSHLVGNYTPNPPSNICKYLYKPIKGI